MFLSFYQKRQRKNNNNEKTFSLSVRFYSLVNFSICIISFLFGFDAVCTIITVFTSDGGGQICQTEAATRGSCVVDLVKDVKDFKQAKPMQIVLR